MSLLFWCFKKMQQQVSIYLMGATYLYWALSSWTVYQIFLIFAVFKTKFTNVVFGSETTFAGWGSQFYIPKLLWFLLGPLLPLPSAFFSSSSFKSWCFFQPLIYLLSFSTKTFLSKWPADSSTFWILKSRRILEGLFSTT